MILKLVIFYLTVSIKVKCSDVYNECNVLTAICRQDPHCPNAELFDSICLKKFLQYKSEIVTERSGSDQQQTLNNDNKQPVYNSENYDYDSSKHYPNNQQNIDYKKLSFTNIRELLDIYNSYKEHSLDENTALNTGSRNKNFLRNSEGYNSEGNLRSSARELQLVKKAVGLLRKVDDLKRQVVRRKQLTKPLNRKEIITGEIPQDSTSNLNSQQVKVDPDRKKKRDQFLGTGTGEDQSERSTPSDIESESTTLHDTIEEAIPLYSSTEKKEETLFEIEKRSGKYLVLKFSKKIESESANHLAKKLQQLSSDTSVSVEKVSEDTVTFVIKSDQTSANSLAEKLNTDKNFRGEVEDDSGAKIIKASTSDEDFIKSPVKPVEKSILKTHITIFAAVVSACTLALIIAAVSVCLIKRRQKDSDFLNLREPESKDNYQELLRTQRQVQNSATDDDDDHPDKKTIMKHNGYDDQFPYNMDISTGHVILAYMEDHLKNENRLNKEWEALCNYVADDPETSVGNDPKNIGKNRYSDVLPYDRTRVKLREVLNLYHSDYINANYITDAAPQNPDYIATQGPLEKTVADFWQMVWEQGVVVIVNLTKLSDMGLPQCHRYWPEDGCETYHIYEVHLISEHIWCDDYFVRSLYLKNLQTGETRTITQFQYLSWEDLSIPESPKPLLEFRRKVNKCYRGQSCPIIVHCNNGVGRTGTYILLDMVLNKMVKGAKEIDIAATLEHIRDQRQDMVKTKGQFEFALTAMAEEVTAILSAVPK